MLQTLAQFFFFSGLFETEWVLSLTTAKSNTKQASVGGKSAAGGGTRIQEAS